jgi:cytidylate kinase
LAARLGYTFLDTGALYRAVALVASKTGVSWDDGVGVGDLTRALETRFVEDDRGTRLFANGTDVTEGIRTSEIAEGASRVSALPEVRAGLLDVQRRVAKSANVVAEGRDIGTVVFPLAPAKFFLSASPETRARRRLLELQAAGRSATFEDVLAEIGKRDARDTGRAIAPLRRAADAIEIDSSTLSADEVLKQMIAVVRERGG